MVIRCCQLSDKPATQIAFLTYKAVPFVARKRIWRFNVLCINVYVHTIRSTSSSGKTETWTTGYFQLPQYNQVAKYSSLLSK